MPSVNVIKTELLGFVEMVSLRYTVLPGWSCTVPSITVPVNSVTVPTTGHTGVVNAMDRSSRALFSTRIVWGPSTEDGRVKLCENVPEELG